MIGVKNGTRIFMIVMIRYDLIQLNLKNHSDHNDPRSIETQCMIEVKVERGFL